MRISFSELDGSSDVWSAKAAIWGVAADRTLTVTASTMRYQPGSVLYRNEMMSVLSCAAAEVLQALSRCCGTTARQA